MKDSRKNYYNKEAHKESKSIYAYYRYDSTLDKEIKEEVKLEKDGTYTVSYVDPESNEVIESKFDGEGKDWISVLDDMDKEWATKEERFHDENAKNICDENGLSILDLLVAKTGNPETDLFLDVETEQALVELVKEAIDTLSDSWQELFYAHYGAGDTLEQIKDEENARLGTNKSKQAISKRHQKMINAVRKYLASKGIE